MVTRRRGGPPSDLLDIVAKLVQQFFGVLTQRRWTQVRRQRRVGVAVPALHDAHVQLASRAVNLEKLVGERTVKLRETISELESFSYSITHDLRGPLSAVAHQLVGLHRNRIRRGGDWRRLDHGGRALTLHTHLKMEGVWRVLEAGQRWPRPAHEARVVLRSISETRAGPLSGLGTEPRGGAANAPESAGGAAWPILPNENLIWAEHRDGTNLTDGDRELAHAPETVGLADRVESLVARVGLATTLPTAMHVDALIEATDRFKA